MMVLTPWGCAARAARIRSHAELDQVIGGRWRDSRARIWGNVRARQLGQSQDARNSGHGAAGPLRQTAALTRMAPLKTPEGRLTSLFLDMVAAERGGAANTLEAYARDLDDLILSCYLSRDFHEGVRAFLERRKPDWQGR